MGSKQTTGNSISINESRLSPKLKEYISPLLEDKDYSGYYNLSNYVPTIKEKRLDIYRRNIVYSETSLINACKNKNEDEVKLLVNAGINVNAIDNSNRSCLLIACDNHNNEIIKLLLENGADVKYRDRDGNTPLLISSKRNKNDNKYAKVLIEKGADVNATNIYGDTSFTYACKNNNNELLRLLILNGSKINKCVLNLKDKYEIIDLLSFKQLQTIGNDPYVKKRIISFVKPVLIWFYRKNIDSTDIIDLIVSFL